MMEPREGRWRGGVRGLLGSAICFILLAGALQPARVATSDEEVAQFLLKQARKAISARKYSEAIQKLERVREEDPKLAEASYLLGTVFDKQQAPGKALGAYRAFRDTCQELGDAIDRKTGRLLKKALKRIAKLDKGGGAFRALQKRFADKLTSFASLHQEDDPDIAIDALRRVLAVSPDHKNAGSLLANLTGLDDLTDADSGNEGGAGDQPASPIPGITQWRDMLAKRDLPPTGEKSYKRRILTIDQREGSVFWTAGPVRAPQTFVYDMEFRFLEVYKTGYLVGLAFAQDEEAERNGESEFVMGFAQRSQLTLVHASGGKNIDVGQCVLRAKPDKTWQRLTIAVQGRKVRVYLDGKKLLTSAIPGRKSLAGPVGVFHQRCVCEIRTLRLGTKP